MVKSQDFSTIDVSFLLRHGLGGYSLHTAENNIQEEMLLIELEK